MSPSHRGVRFTSGSLPHTADADRVYDRQGWETLTARVGAAAQKLGNEMLGGHVTAMPMIKKQTAPCDFCAYKPFCRNAKTPGGL